jgi:hypothetical protein
MQVTRIEYRGHKIDPTSHQDTDMPGHWFPRATVESPAGECKQVTLPPARGVSKPDADAAAVVEAKRRIASNNL